MKYLHLFDTQADFESAYNGEDYGEPWVGLVKANGKVSYNKPPQPYVEIGGVKWAAVNLGAENPWDYGLYFQWADIQGYTLTQIAQREKEFDESTYKYCDSDGHLTKYTDATNKLLPEDDAVHVAWHSTWRIPSRDDFEALMNATTTAWTYDYENTNVAGIIYTDKNDSSKKLFFPANGSMWGYDTGSAGRACAYWVDETEDYNPEYAYIVKGDSYNPQDLLHTPRWVGAGIRGILYEE